MDLNFASDLVDAVVNNGFLVMTLQLLYSLPVQTLNSISFCNVFMNRTLYIILQTQRRYHGNIYVVPDQI